MKTLSQHINEALNDDAKDGDKLIVIVAEPAKAKFLKDLKDNKVEHSHVSGNKYEVTAGPKAYMAFKMVKERNGANALVINKS